MVKFLPVEKFQRLSFSTLHIIAFPAEFSRTALAIDN
jgi:hypothetical protein